MSRLVLFLTMVCVVDGFSCGARHCCGITAHDSVARCFGKDIWGDTIDIPSTPSYFSSIETSEANACGITVEGTRCYGHDHGYGLLNPPPDPLKKMPWATITHVDCVCQIRSRSAGVGMT